MAQTISVLSMAPMAMRLAPALPSGVAPGDAPVAAPLVINGANGPLPGVTRGVDAALFRDWMARNANHEAVANGLIREATSEDIERLHLDPIEYGFEPRLQRTAAAMQPVQAEPAEGRPTPEEQKGESDEGHYTDPVSSNLPLGAQVETDVLGNFRSTAPEEAEKTEGSQSAAEDSKKSKSR